MVHEYIIQITKFIAITLINISAPTRPDGVGGIELNYVCMWP